MGGIIDVALRAPDTSCKGPYGQPTDKKGCFNGIASVDLIEGRALLQGPLPVKDWTFAAGLRRSWVDAWLGPVLSNAGANIRTLPVYYDWQLIAENKPTRDSRLSLRFFGSDDRFAAVIDPLAEEPGFGGNLSFSETNWTAQGLYEGQIARKLSERVMTSVSRSTVRFGLGGTFDFNIILYPIQYRHEFGWNMAPGIKLNAGLDTQAIPYDVAIISPPPPRARASRFRTLHQSAAPVRHRNLAVSLKRPRTSMPNCSPRSVGASCPDFAWTIRATRVQRTPIHASTRATT